MNNRLEGKRAVVTGSTGGIGSEVARMLCEAGCKVVPASVDSAEARAALAAETGAPRGGTSPGVRPRFRNAHRIPVSRSNRASSRTWGSLTRCGRRAVTEPPANSTTRRRGATSCHLSRSSGGPGEKSVAGPS